jgi:hypothetical protein
MDTDVSLRARYERFPATVKGAFVVRGEDAYPHQIAFHEARVVRVPGPGSRIIPLDPVTLDVPPHKDLFVPFEFPIGELDPAWYGLEAEVEVDGGRRTMDGGKRFCVPWPRALIRTVSLRLDRKVTIDDAAVSLDRFQSGAEGVQIRFVVQPPQEITLRVFADDRKLEVVEQEIEPASGRGRTRAYPLLKSHQKLRIEVSGSAKGTAEQVEVDLPS